MNLLPHSHISVFGFCACSVDNIYRRFLKTRVNRNMCGRAERVRKRRFLFPCLIVNFRCLIHIYFNLLVETK